MDALKPPDLMHLNAAQGWLGLGNHLEANEELEKITHKNRVHPSVLAIRYVVYSRAEKWDLAAQIAAVLVTMQPDEPGAWTMLAYATRRKLGGGIPQAMDVLTSVVKRFPTIWMIPYNLACYCAQLNRLEECEEWFKSLFEKSFKALPDVRA
jgi:tetratricopeptide (TPR) repeat protein